MTEELLTSNAPRKSSIKTQYSNSSTSTRSNDLWQLPLLWDPLCLRHLIRLLTQRQTMRNPRMEAEARRTATLTPPAVLDLSAALAPETPSLLPPALLQEQAVPSQFVAGAGLERSSSPLSISAQSPPRRRDQIARSQHASAKTATSTRSTTG